MYVDDTASDLFFQLACRICWSTGDFVCLLSTTISEKLGIIHIYIIIELVTRTAIIKRHIQNN